MRLAILLCMLICIAPAQITAPAVQLEAGIAKEEVDGDLKSAMEVYQKIANDSSAPRDVRAKALLRLGNCYEKLGRQANKVYEQVVRDYPDLPAAAQARTRLASLKQQSRQAAPATMTVRQIERSQLGRFGVTDTDGERVVHQNHDGTLIFGDLAGHTKKVVFKDPRNQDFGWVASRNFSKVLLTFPAKQKGASAVAAVINIDGSGYHEILHDETNQISSWSMDWSWDDRFVLFFTNPQPPDRAGYLFAIELASGHRIELPIPNGYVRNAMFSPDSRFVAFEISPTLRVFESSRIFVVSFPAGGTTGQIYHSAATVHSRTLLDWTADGRYLAVCDAPTGKSGLYLIPIKDGGATGNPVFVRSGEFYAGQTTRAGALVFQNRSTKQGSRVHMVYSHLDTAGRVEGWRELEHRGYGRFAPYPSFSPDGNYIAYRAADNELNYAQDLVLRQVATGEERVLYRSANRHLGVCQYSLDRPRIFCTEIQEDGKTDLIAIESDSANVEHLASFGQSELVWQPVANDRAIYLLQHSGDPDEHLVRWDPQTNNTTAIASDKDAEPLEPSPDERWLLVLGKDRRLGVRPMSGGGSTALSSSLDQTRHLAFTQDGNWILYHDLDPAGKDALYRVRPAGGEPQQIGDFPSPGVGASLHISADGRQLIAVVSDYDDLSILENFIPSAKQPGGAR